MAQRAATASASASSLSLRVLLLRAVRRLLLGLCRKRSPQARQRKGWRPVVSAVRCWPMPLRRDRLVWVDWQAGQDGIVGFLVRMMAF